MNGYGVKIIVGILRRCWCLAQRHQQPETRVTFEPLLMLSPTTDAGARRICNLMDADY